MRYVITGSSGLIGGALAADLTAAGHQVVKLVRRPPRAADEQRWDPLAAADGLDPGVLSGAAGVVHLAGAPIASRRWSPGRKDELRRSRLESTAVMVRALRAAADPPAVLLSGSAIGWYGDRGDQVVDERAPAGHGFLADLVRDWEAAAWPAGEAGISVAALRTGIVLSGGGGALGRMLPLFRAGLGARLGNGRQYLSWISLADHVRAMRFLLDQPALDGPVNLTAPGAVTNAEFTAALGRALRRPALLQVPAPLLRLGLGEAAGELLAGARVAPRKLLDAGFSFRHADIGAALAAVLRPDAAA